MPTGLLSLLRVHNVHVKAMSSRLFICWLGIEWTNRIDRKDVVFAQKFVWFPLIGKWERCACWTMIHWRGFVVEPVIVHFCFHLHWRVSFIFVPLGSFYPKHRSNSTISSSSARDVSGFPSFVKERQQILFVPRHSEENRDNRRDTQIVTWDMTKESVGSEHPCRCHLFWNVRMTFECLVSRLERERGRSVVDIQVSRKKRDEESCHPSEEYRTRCTSLSITCLVMWGSRMDSELVDCLPPWSSSDAIHFCSLQSSARLLEQLIRLDWDQGDNAMSRCVLIMVRQERECPWDAWRTLSSIRDTFSERLRRRGITFTLLFTYVNKVK